MTTKEQTFLKLIKSALYDKPNLFGLDTTIDWQNVYSEAEKQAVICLLADLLNTPGISIPTSVKMAFSERISKNVITFHRHLHYQQEAIFALQQCEIPVVILKGSVAAANYPIPEYRTLGDIDLFISAKDFEAARNCLLRLGYKLAFNENGQLNEAVRQKHLALQKDDILLELHVNPFLIQDEKMDAVLNHYMHLGLDDIQTVSLEGYKIPALPVLQNALEYLIHIQEHLCGTGIGLRQILDWSLFVEKQLTDDIYQNQLLPILRETGLETFAKSLTRMCQLYLGLSETVALWCKDADEKVCEQLLDFVLTQGNFGKKNADDNGARALARLNHPVEFLKWIQFVGLKNFPKFRKNRFLKYFAWIPQTGRYIKYVITNKSNLNKDVKEGQKRRAMFDALRIFEK